MRFTNATTGTVTTDGATIGLEGPNLLFRSYELGNIMQFSVRGTSGSANVIEISGTAFSASFDNISNLGRSDARWRAVFATNGVIQTSDARLKTKIQPIGYGLSAVMKMRPVAYHWKDTLSAHGRNLGFVAQEMLELVPEVVNQEGPHLGMKYAELIPVLTKAIQEQQAEIETLKQQNQHLSLQQQQVLNRLEAFERQLAKLEAALTSPKGN
jgi:hypothetical protein